MGKGRCFSSLLPSPHQEHQKVELLRKAVQAHRAYTDQVSERFLSLLA